MKFAAIASYSHADPRRHILTKYPLFDSGSGGSTQVEAPAYSIAGPDPDAVQDRVPVAPGKGVAVANTHLTSDPYGPEMLRDGASLADVLINETDTRMPEAQALIDGLAPLVASGIPVILTGDFNAASWRDWVGKPCQ